MSNKTIFQAIRQNRIDSLSDFVQSVNARDRYGFTPLLMAIRLNKFDIARELIRLGADVNMPDNSGDSPLMKLITKWIHESNRPSGSGGGGGGRDGVDYIDGLHDSKILQDVFHVLKDAGADINARNEKGQTLLFVAVKNDNINLVKLLMNAGADPNIPDNRTDTPLMMAALKGDIDMVRVLIERANLYAINRRGQTALMLSTKPQTRKLLENKMKVDLMQNARQISQAKQSIRAGLVPLHRQLVPIIPRQQKQQDQQRQAVLRYITSGEMPDDLWIQLKGMLGQENKRSVRDRKDLMKVFSGQQKRL